MYCYKCGKETVAGAPFCRFCGQAVEPRAVTSPQASQVTAKAVQPQMLSPTVKKGWARRHPVLLLVLASIILGVIYAGVSGPQKPPPTIADAAFGDSDAKFRAQVLCREAIKKSLKAPSSADFESSLADRIYYKGAGKFTVYTEVDAVNSFNAKLHAGFGCVVHCTDEDTCSVTEIKQME